MEHLWENAKELAKQAIDLGFTGEWLLALPVAIEIAFQQKGNMILAEVNDTKQGRMVFQPYFELDENANRYIFKEYHAARIKKVPIEHTMIGDLDTKSLDEEMGNVHWPIDHKAMAEDIEAMTIERSKMIDTAEQCLDKLKWLSESGEAGMEIADLLKVKYLNLTPYEDLVPESLKDRFFKSRVFSVDGTVGMTTQEAFNILCGRAVHKVFTDEHDEVQAHWFKARLPGDESISYNTEPFFQDQVRYPDYGLSVTLRKLPLELNDAEDFKRLTSALRQGNIVRVPVRLDGTIAEMRLWAMPETKGIGIMDANGRRITADELMRQDRKTTSKEQKTKMARKGNRKKGI